MATLEWTFREAQEYGRTLLIGHLPAGFPDMAGSIRALRVLSRSVDVLEVGLPQPNRELDGPDLYDASRRAVAAGTTAMDAIEVLREVASSVDIPVLLRSYWHPIRLLGPAAAASALADAGAAGAVLPDLHPHSQGAARWLLASARHRLVTPFTAAVGQTYSAAGLSTGWVHLPLSTDSAGDLDVELLRARAWRIASMSLAPVCAGGDFLRPNQVARIAPAVDAVEISAPFVRAVQLALTDRNFQLLDQCASDYSEAVRARASGQAA
ncbi:tryptophan synthase subunit alpha [Streptomyces niveus]|uniref:tryptophan synthase subunit alpha n=1 Tax=Streptomyces niveus TaxID=193462 RepID=UPI0036C45503